MNRLKEKLNKKEARYTAEKVNTPAPECNAAKSNAVPNGWACVPALFKKTIIAPTATAVKILPASNLLFNLLSIILLLKYYAYTITNFLIIYFITFVEL
jgi:hypothetical protein